MSIIYYVLLNSHNNLLININIVQAEREIQLEHLDLHFNFNQSINQSLCPIYVQSSIYNS